MHLMDNKYHILIFTVIMSPPNLGETYRFCPVCAIARRHTSFPLPLTNRLSQRLKILLDDY